jgi:hypothetical protein
MTVFAGGATGTGAATNAVWTLSHANGQGGTAQWVNTVANGAPGSPAKRQFQSAVYDPTSNRMMIFGGGTASGAANDVWALKNANGLGGSSSWIGFALAGLKPEGRSNLGAAYDPTTNSMMIFGGSCLGDGWFNGVWVLSDANGL